MIEEVYVVTSGEYSAYRIERVFLDRAEADVYVQRLDDEQIYGDDARVEVHPVTARSPSVVSYHHYCVVLEGGQIIHENRQVRKGWDDDPDIRRASHSAATPDGHRESIWITGPTLEYVNKVMSEQIAMALA
jgi:hypothetical protein